MWLARDSQDVCGSDHTASSTVSVTKSVSIWVVIMRKLLQELTINSVPRHIPSPKEWENTEACYEVRAPEDLKQFLNKYGAGKLYDFFRIMSPAKSASNTISYMNHRVTQNFLNDFKKVIDSGQYFGDKQISILVNSCKLLPWATSTNGQVLYWCNFDSFDYVIIDGQRDPLMQLYKMPITVFLENCYSTNFSLIDLQDSGELNLEYITAP